jgi:FkbM family methyltransferase
MRIKSIANAAIKPLGYQFQRVRKQNQDAEAFAALLWLRERNGGFIKFCADHYGQSRAQLFQDLFALWATNKKPNGYFVEFGATNGVDINNTHLLEHSYGWNGILAEPARCWHDELRANRKCAIDTRCVWSTTGERLEFSETAEPEFASLATTANAGLYAHRRHGGTKYAVETVSLDDLLASHNAPKQIDYMSIDTEGAELEILSSFSFTYDIGVITVEHNEQRDALHTILTRHGYEKKFEDLSAWDAWYIKSRQDRR